MFRSQYVLSLPNLNPNYFMSMVPAPEPLPPPVPQDFVLQMLPKPDGGYTKNMLWEFYLNPSNGTVTILNDQGLFDMGSRYATCLDSKARANNGWRSPQPGDPVSAYWKWYLEKYDPYLDFISFQIKYFPDSPLVALVSGFDNTEGLNLPAGDFGKNLIWWSGAGLENNSQWALTLVRQFNGDLLPDSSPQ